MTGTAPGARAQTLRELIELRGPIDQTVSAVRRLPWDSDADLVRLTVRDVVRALDSVANGNLSEAELREWAETIDGRDDIGFEPAHAEALREFIFAAASPEICGSVVAERDSWSSRLTS